MGFDAVTGTSHAIRSRSAFRNDTVYRVHAAIVARNNGQMAKPSLLAVFSHPDDETIVSPLLAKYAHLVGQADTGAVTHAGGVVWPEAEP